jgi:hypothetical protein
VREHDRSNIYAASEAQLADAKRPQCVPDGLDKSRDNHLDSRNNAHSSLFYQIFKCHSRIGYRWFNWLKGSQPAVSSSITSEQGER